MSSSRVRLVGTTVLISVLRRVSGIQRDPNLQVPQKVLTWCHCSEDYNTRPPTICCANGSLSNALVWEYDQSTVHRHHSRIVCCLWYLLVTLLPSQQSIRACVHVCDGHEWHSSGRTLNWHFDFPSCIYSELSGTKHNYETHNGLESCTSTKLN